MELGPKNHTIYGFRSPNSMLALELDPLEKIVRDSRCVATTQYEAQQRSTTHRSVTVKALSEHYRRLT